jgi:hypothetical protein
MKWGNLIVAIATSTCLAGVGHAIENSTADRRADLTASMDSIRWMIEDSPERIRRDFSILETQATASPEDPELARLEKDFKKHGVPNSKV